MGVPDGAPRLLRARVIHHGSWEGLGEINDLCIVGGKFASIIVTPTDLFLEKSKLTFQEFGAAVDAIALGGSRTEKSRTTQAGLICVYKPGNEDEWET